MRRQPSGSSRAQAAAACTSPAFARQQLATATFSGSRLGSIDKTVRRPEAIGFPATTIGTRIGASPGDFIQRRRTASAQPRFAASDQSVFGSFVKTPS
jgi:hypothetical protein